MLFLGASAALLTAEALAATIWYLTPRFSSEAEVGIFRLPLDAIPPAEAAPVGQPVGRFWLVNTRHGLLALNMLCVKCGWLYKWVPANGRFECPSCGSKYASDATKIKSEGPARRNLDRYLVYVDTPSGIRHTAQDGGPVSLDGAKSIIVYTRRLIKSTPVT